MKSQITKAEYLMALGLFHLATEHRRKCGEFEKGLHELLGVDDALGSHISDAIYEDNDTLDAALKRQKITVEPDGETP